MNPTAAHIAAHCLLMRTRRLSRLTTRLYVDQMAHLGLSVGQFSVLTAVGCAPGVRAADLVHALDLERSTLSRELAGLVNRGLVHSEPVDGRSQALALTPAGEALLADARPHWERAQAEAAEALGPIGDLLLERFSPG
jgi:DNA-binding MarR family transcriptional regulator